MRAMSAVVGVKRRRVSASEGGDERERREGIAGAPAMMKPAVKVRRVRARARGSRIERGFLGGGGVVDDEGDGGGGVFVVCEAVVISD